MRRGRNPGGWPAGGDAGTGTVAVLSGVRRPGQRRNIVRCRGIMVTERGSPRPIHLMPVNLVGGVFVQRFADVRRHLLLVRPRRSGHCREIGVRGSRVLPAHEVGKDHDGKNDQCGNGTPPLHGERKPVTPNDHAHKVVDSILEVTVARSHSASTQGLPRTPGPPSDAGAATSAPRSEGVARSERPGAPTSAGSVLRRVAAREACPVPSLGRGVVQAEAQVLDVVEGLAEEFRDVVVVERVDDGAAASFAGDQAEVAQQAELVRAG
ncbi:hypothetical protein GA0115261_121053 [Streptomyces sp. OspMP-M43]|nr:hypothetical protein GA0115261_121053 [Streptomyces sp. OspMP-M43]